MKRLIFVGLVMFVLVSGCSDNLSKLDNYAERQADIVISLLQGNEISGEDYNFTLANFKNDLAGVAIRDALRKKGVTIEQIDRFITGDGLVVRLKK